jgi:hypothetical protein
MRPAGHDDITGIYELLDAIEAVIKAADPGKREALARTIDSYAEDFPDDFYWAIGPQAPMLLNHLINTIDSALPSGGTVQASPRHPDWWTVSRTAAHKDGSRRLIAQKRPPADKAGGSLQIAQ